MDYNFTHYNCLIISPGDVQAERRAVAETLREWNAHIGRERRCHVEPITWETHGVPDASGPVQQVLTPQIVDIAHFGVAIFSTRLGTPTEKHLSGSVEEIERLIERRVHVSVYFNDADVPPDRLHDRQYRDLMAFKEHLGKRAYLGSYSSVENLQKKVLLHVTKVVDKLLLARLGAPSVTGVLPADPANWASVHAGPPEWVRSPVGEAMEGLGRALAASHGLLPTRQVAVPAVVIVNRSPHSVTITLRLLIRKAGHELIGTVTKPVEGSFAIRETNIRYPISLDSGDAEEGQVVFEVPLPTNFPPKNAEFLLELTDRLHGEHTKIYVPLPGTYPPAITR
jgi:hypothetical protein